MGEMKNGSTDPKVIAATIIINHGVAVAPGVVTDVVWSAVGTQLSSTAEVARVIDEVSERIRIAEVDVRWPDDEDDRGTFDVSDAQACDGPCCAPQSCCTEGTCRH